jgi:NAD(P)H-dependent FMN reductase
MSTDLNLGLIYGSARPGRMCDTVADWVKRRMAEWLVANIDIIDPADPVVAAAVGEQASGREHLAIRIDHCDAFIVVTREYNHSFPAPLKAVIDSAKDEWAAKPVAFVSYGGFSGGIRAVEQLRLVFAELHAVGIRDGVSFMNVSRAFDSGGEPVDNRNPANALELMLKRLAWWANALKRARAERSYFEPRT